MYLIAQTGAGQGVVEAAKQGSPVQVVKTASGPLIEASRALWKAGGVRSLFAGKITLTLAALLLMEPLPR